MQKKRQQMGQTKNEQNHQTTIGKDVNNQSSMNQELDMEPKRSEATIDQMLGVVHQVPED